MIEGSFIFNFQFGNIRYSEEAPLFEDSIKSSPTAKAAEKEHKDNKKNNFSPFLGSIGWKQEWATKRSEIVRVDELSKLTNGVVSVFGCVFV